MDEIFIVATSTAGKTTLARAIPKRPDVRFLTVRELIAMWETSEADQNHRV